MRRQAALALPLVLGTVGLALAWYLLQAHLEVFAGGVREGLFCGGAGGRFDCGAVAAHPSSWFLGCPLPVLGVLFYVGVLALGIAAASTRGADQKALLALGALVACLVVTFDLWLLWVMVLDVGALCPACLATHAVNLGLALSFWQLARGLPVPLRPSRGERARIKGGLAVLAVLAAVALVAAYLAAMRPFARLRAEGEATLAGLVERMATTAPELDMARFEGQPARGPASADVTIALAGDFQCSHCRTLAGTLHALQGRWPEGLRVIWVNAPVSSRCNPAVGADLHPEACWLAEVGEAAAEAGRFWAYHDWLTGALPLARARRDVVHARLAELGLDPAAVDAALAGGAPRRAVARDVALCGQLGLTSTPSLAIDGYVVRGALAPWLIERLLEGLLEPAGQEPVESPH